MNKAEVIAELAKEVDMTQSAVREVLDVLALLAASELRKGHDFTVPGLCKLTVAQRAARVGRNLATGEAVDIPARQVVKVKALAAINAAVGAK